MPDELKKLSDEQRADLAALTAAADDGAPPLLPGETAEPAGADDAEQWAILPAMIGSTLAMAMPELKEVYTQEACRAWGAAMVPVAGKYGWSADAIAGPEMGLAACTLPLVAGTIVAVQHLKERTALIRMKREADARAHFAISRGLPGDAPGEPAPPQGQEEGRRQVTFG